MHRAFAIGLGPVPFVIIPEVAPFHVRPRIAHSARILIRCLGRLRTVVHRNIYQLYAVPSALFASTDIVLGFVNFFVGLFFLPLSHWLSDNNPYKEGRVFYLFAAVFFVSFIAFLRAYKA